MKHEYLSSNSNLTREGLAFYQVFLKKVNESKFKGNVKFKSSLEIGAIGNVVISLQYFVNKEIQIKDSIRFSKHVDENGVKEYYTHLNEYLNKEEKYYGMDEETFYSLFEELSDYYIDTFIKKLSKNLNSIREDMDKNLNNFS